MYEIVCILPVLPPDSVPSPFAPCLLDRVAAGMWRLVSESLPSIDLTPSESGFKIGRAHFSSLGDVDRIPISRVQVACFPNASSPDSFIVESYQHTRLLW